MVGCRGWAGSTQPAEAGRRTSCVRRLACTSRRPRSIPATRSLGSSSRRRDSTNSTLYGILSVLSKFYIFLPDPDVYELDPEPVIQNTRVWIRFFLSVGFGFSYWSHPDPVFLEGSDPHNIDMDPQPCLGEAYKGLSKRICCLPAELVSGRACRWTCRRWRSRPPRCSPAPGTP